MTTTQTIINIATVAGHPVTIAVALKKLPLVQTFQFSATDSERTGDDRGSGIAHDLAHGDNRRSSLEP